MLHVDSRRRLERRKRTRAGPSLTAWWALMMIRLAAAYRQTLDEPIPSLDNQSPRKAAKKGKGREKVIAWLKMLENHAARAGAGRSGRRLRLHLDLEGTWPRRRASMNPSSDLPRALSRER